MNADTVLDDQHRRALVFGSWAVAAGAVGVPLLAGSDVGPLQVIVALAAMYCFLAEPFTRRSMPIALGAVALEGALTLPGSTFPVVHIVISAVLALAACEGLALARMWRTRGVLRWSAERVHVVAAAQRVGVGAGAALAVLLLGYVELPSAAVIATVGVLAAGAVVWILATRAT